MAFVDYYKILGVDKNIPQKDVRTAYRKRAKQFHPDLHPNDPKAKAKFQALNEAYDVINDPDKRAKYDQYGQRWKEMEAFQNAGGAGFGGSAGGTGSPFDGFDFGNFRNGSSGVSDFFESIFSGMGHGRSTSASSAQSFSADIESTVNIDLYTALLGGDVMLTLGNGQKLKMKIKPCTQNGQKVRLRGKGNAAPNGTAGDLIITYNVKMPTTLNERQRDLLRQMHDEG